MPRMILMRHAKSSWGGPALDDFDRPLNKRGRASARAMGDWLRGNSYLPDAVLCSAATRTRETLAGLGLSSDVDVQFSRDLYHAQPQAILRHLNKATAECILLIGHNPGIADAAHQLLRTPPKHPRFDDYPTCATLVADFDVTSWADVSWSRGAAVDFAIPREVIGEED
ncbi:histidine phosphatase family protein [Sulfitobacter sp. D35]|uniref:SixA phosphatase family protein n=1 Tax=Sulfitobacter sp. D35 TaxID=3083252 RepID=UPI00296EC5B8|nr:histidine phosphatase family protein [Sulfitobacter sp. D35]MDW4500466.1 histidine phosphatase family protein [Sulfitobacter sp. D35]